MAAVWLAAVLALETWGRNSPSDVVDGVGVALIVALILWTVLVHRRRPVGVVVPFLELGRACFDWVSRQRVTLGVDFREVPPLPRAFPRLFAAPLAALPLLVPLWMVRSGLPGTVRDALLSGSVTLYLLLLAGLWSALVVVAGIQLLFALVSFHNWFINVPRFARSRRGGIEGSVALAGLAGLVALALLLPLWVPLVVLGATCLLSLLSVLLPGAPPLLVAWRRRVGGEPAAVRWDRLVCAMVVTLPGSMVLFILLAAGDQLAGVSGRTTPITGLLGRTAAWSGMIGFLAWAWLMPLRSLVARFRDPSKPDAPRARVVGARPVDRLVLRELSEAGFDVRLQGLGRQRRDEVQIRLDEAGAGRDLPEHAEPAVGRPLVVHPDGLALPDFHALVRRHHEIRQRRRLLRGLRTLLALAFSRRFEAGQGYWIAPHWWFVTHLTRDTDEDDSWTVGPPYHRAIPLSARRHLYQVLRSLEIDLIFVEDGLAFRRLETVFTTLFDVYDLFGGSRAEERHFDGVSGVRVVIHDFNMERPFKVEDYPQVDYEEIGRARILHVFKDRGGGEDATGAPFDLDWLIQPAGV